MFKHYVHDSMPFFWTTEAVQSGKEVIGFYFDRLGLPQPVSRKSLYGFHILCWEAATQSDHQGPGPHDCGNEIDPKCPRCNPQREGGTPDFHRSQL